MRKPIFILDAGPNTVVGPRAKVMDAVRGGYTKYAYGEVRPHSDLPWSTLVLSHRVIYEQDNYNVPPGVPTRYVRQKDRLRRISDSQQFECLRPDDYAGMGEA